MEWLVDGLRRLQYYHVTGDDSVSGYNNLDELLISRRWNDLTLYNYSVYAQYHAQWNNFLRVCRGAVLDSNGDLVSLPFTKFFNLNEHESSRTEVVVDWSILSVMEKVDGVLIQVFKHNNELVWASRHGIFTEKAMLAKALAGDAIHKLIDNLPYECWTLMMELVHPGVWQPGMIFSCDAALYPLAIRWLHNLELVPASALWRKLPEPFRLPRQYLVHSLEQAVDVVKSAETPDWEGVVLQGAGELGNQLVKLKSPLYMQRLAIVKGLSPKRLVQAYRDGGWDGLYQLIAGVEEIVQRSPLSNVLSMLKEIEHSVRLEVDKYNDVPRERIQEVPVQWRWAIGYRCQPDKLERAIRKAVVAETESRLESEE